MQCAAERLSRSELEALQLQRLREQVRRLMAANPFHRERFAAAGVGADDLRSLDDLRRFPLMTKQDVLADTAAAPPYGRRLGVHPAEIREIVTSGGTAGHEPEIYAFTAQDLAAAVDLYALDQYWKGARTGDIAMMVSEIGMLASPPLNVRAWERLGMPVLRVGPNSTEERIAAFLRFKPRVLKLPYVYAIRLM
ncbi:MAG: phenylacetate--CoA ligase, partial [Alphaproteobacteria bacterium]|nr:phenylacetate--CoA ligase [Alphaproteobacteria bacterium]